MSLDFGYGGTENSQTEDTANVNDVNDSSTNLDTGTIDHSSNGISADDISDMTVNEENTNDTKDNKETKNENDKDESNKLVEGTSVSVGDDKYTVDASGNLIDADGNIFKEAKDVDEWLKSFDEVKDNTEELSINSIKEAIGIDVSDENDNPIEFENTPEGIKSYVNAVLELGREEQQEIALNNLYQRYPIIEEVLNYYIANGNSLRGFGEIPDRSNIVIDSTNEAQQEYIIRTAWEEQGRKGNIDQYIAYLKNSGTLFTTAQEELEVLKESDKQYRDTLAEEAERKDNERLNELKIYWNGVHEVIKTRNIAGYQIPENIIINRNGQKFSATPEDFFNYLYKVDANGRSEYSKAVANETLEQRRDDEILRAYLKFVGGNYSNLVDMAINKKKVAELKLKAKERTTSSVKINRPNTNGAKRTSIDVGYK